MRANSNLTDAHQRESLALSGLNSHLVSRLIRIRIIERRSVAMASVTAVQRMPSVHRRPDPWLVWMVGGALTLAWGLAGDAARAEGSRPVTSLLEFRQQNVVLQEWDLSCGAAALTTLLRYQYGDQVTEKAVATELVNRPEYIDNPQLVQIREGFSLLDLKRYVDARGYRGIGFGQMSLADLVDRAPVLVPIRTKGYNHFVVFRGHLGNRVLLGDPAWGNRTMTESQFNRAWINYPQIGRVGFIVESQGADAKAPHALSARPADFVTFN